MAEKEKKERMGPASPQVRGLAQMWMRKPDREIFTAALLATGIRQIEASGYIALLSKRISLLAQELYDTKDQRRWFMLAVLAVLAELPDLLLDAIRPTVLEKMAVIGREETLNRMNTMERRESIRTMVENYRIRLKDMELEKLRLERERNGQSA